MSKNVEYRNEMQMDRDVRSDAIAVRTILGSEGSLNWSREIWILVKQTPAGGSFAEVFRKPDDPTCQQQAPAPIM